MPRATMDDVARLAGVSKATVSRALRGDSRISPQTRERIWKVAREVGYKPDLSASSLSGGKTGIAAIIIDETEPWLSGPHFLEGLNRVLSRAGMDLLLKLPGFRPGDLFSNLGARRADCILWAGGAGNAPLPGGPLFAPMVTAGFAIPGFPAVLISPERTLDRLNAPLGGKTLPHYCRGSGPLLFPFLEKLLQVRHAPDETIIPVFDGFSGEDLPGGGGFVCALQGSAPREGKYSLEWPAFEFGAAAGRIMLKLLQGRSPVPSATYLIPALKSPCGEIIPYVK